MLILSVSFFCLLWHLKIGFIGEDCLKSVRYLMGAFYF